MRLRGHVQKCGHRIRRTKTTPSERDAELFTDKEMTMTGEELQKMPKTSALMTKEEFAAWILSRKDAGATIEIETAELIGWWAPENKRVAVQSRIDEHNRKEEEFYENRRAAGRQIDIDTCEGYWEWADDTDPYGIALVPYEQISKNSYVRNKGSDDWVHVSDLPKEKRQALDERAERERSARRRILDGLFDALRQGGGLAAAVGAITEAESIPPARSATPR
jgi:hypothetical protein